MTIVRKHYRRKFYPRFGLQRLSEFAEDPLLLRGLSAGLYSLLVFVLCTPRVAIEFDQRIA